VSVWATRAWWAAGSAGLLAGRTAWAGLLPRHAVLGRPVAAWLGCRLRLDLAPARLASCQPRWAARACLGPLGRVGDHWSLYFSKAISNFAYKANLYNQYKFV